MGSAGLLHELHSNPWFLVNPNFICSISFTGIRSFGAFIVFIGIVIIKGFAENIVKPKYMGKELDLSPFTVVFSVFFWSAVLGPLGAILSVPITMAIKSLILEPDASNRWLADLMSAEPHPRTAEPESIVPKEEAAEE